MAQIRQSKSGRRKNSRNRGYFYRSGRGWYASDNGGRAMVPLCYEDGCRIRERDADPRLVQEAHARWLLTRHESNGDSDTVPSDATVVEICDAYLADAKVNGAMKTYQDRAETLFDFCFGLLPQYRNVSNPSPMQLQEMNRNRIHPGYGQLVVSELTPLHIDKWLNAHVNWKGGRRSRIQAVKRALNYAVERKMIAANPIKGYRTPRSKGRITYITSEQEKALCSTANKALATAIRVCIRTGARFGCEFTRLTAKHVQNHGSRMEWVFPPSESKTNRLRIIRIVDPEIIEIVRRQMKLHPIGPIFRNSRNEPWTEKNLSQRFRFLKRRLQKEGIEFDADACMYSCRHTYAKRTLEGYWSRRPTTIETLARLMGNSPQVCRDHYLQWCEAYNEPLWEAC